MISRPSLDTPVLSDPFRTFGGMGWDPWGALDDAELIVFEVRMPPPTVGFYDPTTEVAVIEKSLTTSGARSVVAHELAHHVLGHRGDVCPADLDRQEERAQRWAAVRLITIEDLSAALRSDLNVWEVAEELQVDPELLEVRLRWLDDKERRELGWEM